MSSTAGAMQSPAVRTAVCGRELAAAVWLALVLLAFALSLFLTWRRLAGALVLPLDGAAIVVSAIGLELAAATLRSLANDRRFSVLGTEYSVLVRLLPSVAAILLLAALTLPGTPAWGIAAAWLLLTAGEGSSWLSYHRPAPRRRNSEVVAEPEIPDGLVQRVTRIRQADRESLHALVQAEVTANDRMAVVHLAFCPPLAERPELTAHALDADGADIRIAQVETFGARIEVRLPQAEPEPRRVLVEMLGSVICRPGA